MHPITPQQSQYLAWQLTRRAARDSIERLVGKFFRLGGKILLRLIERDVKTGFLGDLADLLKLFVCEICDVLARKHCVNLGAQPCIRNDLCVEIRHFAHDWFLLWIHEISSSETPSRSRLPALIYISARGSGYTDSAGGESAVDSENLSCDV